jgi:hypothetical protein
MTRFPRLLLALALPWPTPAALPDVLSQPANTWVKRTPLSTTPVSPRLGYEGACVWDSRHRVVIRYGGHNQGGGGEQEGGYGVVVHGLRGGFRFASTSGTLTSGDFGPMRVYSRDDDLRPRLVVPRKTPQ